VKHIRGRRGQRIADLHPLTASQRKRHELVLARLRHLPRGRDFTLIIIKGHLLVEERLNDMIACVVDDEARLRDARLTFFQKLCLCQAIYGDAGCWSVARRLNEVRNRLAHRLDHGDMTELVDSILDLVYDRSCGLPSSAAERASRLKELISNVCAFLEGIRTGRAEARAEMVAAWRSSIAAVQGSGVIQEAQRVRRPDAGATRQKRER
jgi:hypothetical protein